MVQKHCGSRPRLIAQQCIVQHRLFERRVGRQALDFIGKPCLEGGIVGRDRRADDGRTRRCRRAGGQRERRDHEER